MLSPTAEETQGAADTHCQGAPPRKDFSGWCIASPVGLCVGRDGTQYSPARLSLSSLSFPPYLCPCLPLTVSAYVHNSQPDSAALSLSPSFLCHISHLCVVVCGAVPLVPPLHTHTTAHKASVMPSDSSGPVLGADSDFEPGLRPWEVLGSKRPPSSFSVGRDAEVREKGGVPGPLARCFSSLRNGVKQLSSFIPPSFSRLSDLRMP